MKLPRTLVGLVGASLALVALSASPGQVAQARSRAHTLPGGYKHLVVIYEENHSFDNLYGGWGRVNGQHVDGLARRPTAQRPRSPRTARPTAACSRTTSTSPRRRRWRPTCHGPGARHRRQPLHQPAVPHRRLHQAEDKTCPAPGVFAGQRRASRTRRRRPGGCTRDLVHRFYQEQYQIDGGKQDRYMTGSDAVGLTHGPLRHQAAADLPLPALARAHRTTSIADHFFQAAFGGSFLNHQWLIAARAPLDTDPRRRTADAAATNSVLDAQRHARTTLPAVHRRPARSSTAS